MGLRLIKCVLLFVVIVRAEGLGKIWKFNSFSVTEKAVKTILESCYENDRLSNPVLIIGDFNEFIDESPTIRINNFQIIEEDSYKHQSFQFKASKIVLVQDSPEKLKADLELLKKTKWWDHMARFFIISKNKKACTNLKDILVTTWKMDVLNSIYICTEPINTTVLYTLNPFANYAPYPWRRMEKLNDSNVFRQVFNPRTSCQNLNFEKTKFLNRHEIKAVTWRNPNMGWKIGHNYFGSILHLQEIDYNILRFIIRRLNASGRFEVEIGINSMLRRFENQTSDMTLHPNTLDSLRGLLVLFPHRMDEMVVVVKLRGEVSTLHKIFKLWSTKVLIAAAIAMVILVLVLTMENNDFFLAMMDLVRLLTYTSIRTNTRSHSFRIYFTTMLILMVISNGVFQGKIASFLSKQERGSAARTIDELVKLRYKMHAPFPTKTFAEKNCQKCNFIEVRRGECIEYVLNSTSHACAISKHRYNANYTLLPLDYIKKPLRKELQGFKCRRDWPLYDRVNDMLMRVVESGIIDFSEMKETSQPKRKRQAMEADWSSPRYKSVKLYKLKFAFQLLACGLSLATVVFYVELRWEEYRRA